MYYCNLFTIVEGSGVSGRGGGEAVGGQWIQFRRMMVLYVGHLLYDDYTLERIYDVLYVYKVHYTLPERITYNRIMHLW